MGRSLLAVAVGVVVTAWGCGAEEPEPAWASGVVLLDHMEQVRILDGEGAALDALPVDVARGPGVLEVEVPPDAWRLRGPLGADLPHLDLPAEALMWEAAPVVRLWLGGRRPSLRHAGRLLERLDGSGFSNVWRDGRDGLLLWWNRNENLLVAVGSTPPGDVRLTSNAAGAPPTRHAGAALEPVQVTRGAETRRALLLPSPVRLLWPPRVVRAPRLDLRVGLQPRLLGHDASGRPVHLPADDVAVTVALAAIGPDGARLELASEIVRGPDAFRQVTASLAAVMGRRAALELSLRTVGAPPGGLTPVVALADGLVSGAGEGGARGRLGRPHVVLIQLDTLRADRLGCYGHERDTSPGLDAWARASAQLFEDAVSDSNWTLPSTATLLTGLATSQHGVLAFPAALGEATPTLAERLRAGGYDTFALTEGGFVSLAFGMDRGFEVFGVQPSHGSDWSAALERIEQRGEDRPVFLFLHTYRVHAPWPEDDLFADPDDPYDGPLAGLDLDEQALRRLLAGELPARPAEVAEVNRRYDAAVRRMDEVVSAFLRELDRRVPAEDRLVIVTSDHGEHLFEHGRISHGETLFDSVLRVPLLVSWPGATPVGRASAPAAGVDIAPTVLDVAGLPRPPGLPGRSLAGVGAHDVLRVSQHAADTHAVLSEGYKLVTVRADAARPRPGLTGLFHRGDDPGETKDLTESEPERAAALALELQRWLADHAPPATDAAEAELDPALLDSLKALGYLGDG